MKRIFSIILVSVLLVTCLCSCGKDEETNYYMKGYEAVEAGNYETALEHFEKAAEAGDDQAVKAAKIVSSYLNAKEAYDVEDIDGAMRFLEDIPSDYKYYAIADDVDSLLRKVYGYVPEEIGEDEPDKKEESESDEAKKSEEEDEPEDVKDAEADDTAEDAAPASAKAEEFTAEKAMEYVSAKYGVQGDLGMGLEPSYTDDGKIYYEIVADVGKDGQSNIKKLRIFSDGTITEQKA